MVGICQGVWGFKCPKCGWEPEDSLRYTIWDSRLNEAITLGKKFKCPKCGTELDAIFYSHTP